jgi:hypothetical protein
MAAAGRRFAPVLPLDQSGTGEDLTFLRLSIASLLFSQ